MTDVSPIPIEVAEVKEAFIKSAAVLLWCYFCREKCQDPTVLFCFPIITEEEVHSLNEQDCMEWFAIFLAHEECKNKNILACDVVNFLEIFPHPIRQLMTCWRARLDAMMADFQMIHYAALLTQ